MIITDRDLYTEFIKKDKLINLDPKKCFVEHLRNFFFPAFVNDLRYLYTIKILISFFMLKFNNILLYYF